MFDLIEIIAAFLSALLIICAVLNLVEKRHLNALTLVVIALWPLMWAGFIRLHIPQTLIWMGMNILAIIFLWQAVSGVLFKAENNNLIKLPKKLSHLQQSAFCLVTGSLFSLLILLTRL